MGALGDSIEQNYELLANNCNDSYDHVRTAHMTAAGVTTGVVVHHWYHHLDRFVGRGRTFKLISLKIILDQVIGSPLSLAAYFATLGLCERSSWRHVKQELVEKGFGRIYLAEWIVWPPLQVINFALVPLRYRILFDNIVSLGFDVYAPYVKYRTQLSTDCV